MAPSCRLTPLATFAVPHLRVMLETDNAFRCIWVCLNAFKCCFFTAETTQQNSSWELLACRVIIPTTTQPARSNISLCTTSFLIFFFNSHCCHYTSHKYVNVPVKIAQHQHSQLKHKAVKEVMANTKPWIKNWTMRAMTAVLRKANVMIYLWISPTGIM